jgi:hypothetical protein
VAANPLFDSFATAGTRALTEYTRAYELYLGALARLSPQPGDDTAALTQRYAEFVRSEYPQLLAGVAKVGMECCTDVWRSWAEVGRSAMEQGNAQTSKPVATPSPGTKPVSSLFFRGPAGARVANGFVVANTRHQPVDVSFAMTELVSDDKTSSVSPTVQFAPATCALTAGAEHVIQCTVWLAEDYLPGVTYRGQIRVAEFPEMAIAVSVEVDAAQKPPAPAPSTAAATRPRAKRKAPRASRR